MRFFQAQNEISMIKCNEARFLTLPCYRGANDLGQEILLDVTNPTIVSYIKIVGFGTG